MKKTDLPTALSLPSYDPEPAPPTTLDPYWGKGGSYVLDPKTGLRTLRQQTQECEDCTLKPKG